MNKKTIISTTAILIVLILLVLIFDWGRKGQLPGLNNNISTSTVEQNSSSTLDMPIVVSYPLDNQEVSSPIKIKGKARGYWFFEASFPIQLADIDGNIITTVIATAESDWMTTDFVNFTAEVNYDNASSTGPALLVLKRDNPSDNPEFDQSIFIPVILK